MMYEVPIVLPVESVIEEAKGTKSLLFHARLKAKPGQFLMIWIPGVDAKPLGIAYMNDVTFGVTVSDVGKASALLCKSKKGTLLGIMGPYGKPFSLKGKRIMLVAGGYGAATLYPLAEQAMQEHVTTTFVIGAKTARSLIYRDRSRKDGLNTIFTTDDGSFGRKGYTTDVLEESLKAGGIDYVYGCGPELMLRKIAELCRRYNTKCQLSIERYMKCGFGICGSCSLDGAGARTCVEGTVFTGTEALKIKEFGQYHRDATGTKTAF